MSFYNKYDHQSRHRPGPSQRTAYGYWIPLGLTILAATVGLAAWAWKERNDNNRDDDDPDYSRRPRRDQAPPGADRHPLFQAEPRPGGTALVVSGNEEESFMNRLSSAARRAPSPQQMYDGASRQVAAGVAAAGAVLGKGLNTIKENDFKDHKRWAEEVETREKDASAGPAVGTPPAKAERARAQVKEKRKMVAVVVSAEMSSDYEVDDEEAYHVAHASFLSSLISLVNAGTTQLLILIYAPHLLHHPLSRTTPPALQRTSSTGSSFSYISNLGTQSQNQVLQSSTPTESPRNALYDALNSQGQALVDHPTQVLPFTAPTGHIHLLRHLSPSTVYLQESLCGSDGEIVQQIAGWVGQVVVVLGGGGIGGGLVDTETESEDAGPEKGDGGGQKWWMDESRVGLGKGVEVVDSVRMGEDWARRIAR